MGRKCPFLFHISDVLVLFCLLAGAHEEFLIKSLNGRSLAHDSMTSPLNMSVNRVLVSSLLMSSEPDLTHISELVLSSEMSGLVIKYGHWKVTVAELLNFSLPKRLKESPGSLNDRELCSYVWIWFVFTVEFRSLIDYTQHTLRKRQ